MESPTTEQTTEPKADPMVNVPIHYEQDIAPQPQQPPAEQNIPSGTDTRVQQDNAKFAKALEAFGIDPASEAVDALANGTIDPATFISSRTPQSQQVQQPVPQTQPAPKSSVQILLEELKSKEQLTNEDLYRTIEVLDERDRETQNIIREQELTNTWNQCMEAVNNTVPKLEGAPDNIQATMNEVLWSLTNESALVEGQRAGNPDAFVNPAAYGTLASRNAERVNSLIGYIKELGKQEYINGLQRPPASRIPTVGNGIGAGAAPPQAPRVTAKNMAEVARSYMKQAQRPPL